MSLQQRLLEMGEWLKVNGEAIYGTRYAGRSCQWSPGELPKQEYGEFMIKYNLMDQIGREPKGGKAIKQLFFAKKAGAIHAITSGWLAPDITVRNIKLPANVSVTMLGVDNPVKATIHGSDLVITPPTLMPQELSCRYNYVFKISGAEFTGN